MGEKELPQPFSQMPRDAVRVDDICVDRSTHSLGPLRKSFFVLAVAVGFEPTVRLPPHTLSRRAPLAARTRHRGRGYKEESRTPICALAATST